ncbi:hypothetical protein [Actinocrispum wychmicini]|uniref:hypothetical protein n=1 Tax=Actinocrispum wychmicini TaxID=1213861 RepID=UPI001FB63720|nr:hypothetical protein [Actinocrispum wychmicini]
MDSAQCADDGTHGLAAELYRIIRATNEMAGVPQANVLSDRVTGHLGVPVSEVVVVSRGWPGWEHANLQRGIDAYLARYGKAMDWFGVVGSHRNFEDLISMLAAAGTQNTYQLGSVDYTTAWSGPTRRSTWCSSVWSARSRRTAPRWSSGSVARPRSSPNPCAGSRCWRPRR